MGKNSPNSAHRHAGFSLIELLTVIAIGAMLASLSMTAFNRIGQAGNLTKAGHDITDFLERARMHAMANNTYVWVGFTPGDNDTLVVGAAASRNGASNPGADDLVPLDRLHRFVGIGLVSLVDSKDRPITPKEAQLANLSSAIHSFSLGGETPVVFDRSVIQFNSRGECRIVPSQPYRITEIGLQEMATGNVRNPANYAAIQVGGLSGAVSMHRP